MLKKSAGGVRDTREAYLVKRRSFPDSFGHFMFYVLPFTNDKDGLFEHPSGRRSCRATPAGHRSSSVPTQFPASF